MKWVKTELLDVLGMLYVGELGTDIDSGLLVSSWSAVGY